MVYLFIQILNSPILINIFVTMGPIEKKINQMLKSEGLSQESIEILIELKKEASQQEKPLINHAYSQGYHDCEMKRGRNSNFFFSRFPSLSYISKTISN